MTLYIFPRRRVRVVAKLAAAAQFLRSGYDRRSRDISLRLRTPSSHLRYRKPQHQRGQGEECRFHAPSQANLRFSLGQLTWVANRRLQKRARGSPVPWADWCTRNCSSERERCRRLPSTMGRDLRGIISGMTYPIAFTVL
jgi:hypothetical protein